MFILERLVPVEGFSSVFADNLSNSLGPKNLVRSYLSSSTHFLHL